MWAVYTVDRTTKKRSHRQTCATITEAQDAAQMRAEGLREGGDKVRVEENYYSIETRKGHRNKAVIIIDETRKGFCSLSLSCGFGRGISFGRGN